MRAKQGLQSLPSPRSCPDQEFELCCCRELVWQELGRNLGAVGWEIKNPGEKEVLEKHRQLWFLAEAAAPCPTAKPCKGQVRSGAGSPRAASCLQFWN